MDVVPSLLDDVPLFDVIVDLDETTSREIFKWKSL